MELTFYWISINSRGELFEFRASSNNRCKLSSLASISCHRKIQHKDQGIKGLYSLVIVIERNELSRDETFLINQIGNDICFELRTYSPIA